MTPELFEQIVLNAVAKVPKEIRAVEEDSLRRSLKKALVMLEGQDEGWQERCIRRMGEQYTIFRGQFKGALQPEKRKK